ncbi:MAG: MaoC family dehydratase N-terminal domain-containing protein [Dehalococcoidia bacterium]
MTTQVEFDRSLLGKEIPSGPFQVTREVILDYCRAIGETSPLYTDEEAARKAGHLALLAPPAFCTIFASRVVLKDINLKFGRVRVHAGQAMESLTPIVAGDVLTASTHLKDVYAKTGRSGMMVFIVWETVFTNQDGVRVALAQESQSVRE